MIAIFIIVFIAGIFVGMKIGGERALRNLTEGERQKMRRAARLTKK